MDAQTSQAMLHGAQLIVIVIALVAITLASKTLLRFVTRLTGPVFKLLFYPLRLAGRSLRILHGASHAPQDAGPVGASAVSALIRLFRSRSLTEKALDADEAGAGGKPHDFKDEESKLARRGLMFHWIDVSPQYVPDTSAFTPEIADAYETEARRFFSGQVSLHSDEQSLYEDTEGEFIVSMFRARDRRAFYLLNEMRKTINQNIRNLAILFSALMSVIFVAKVFFGDAIMRQIAPASPASSAITFSIAICVLGAFLMWLMYYVEYAPNQRNNSREMKNFITRYLSRLSDRYRSAIGNARSVTVGDESDPEKLSGAAQRWHKIVLWMAFRSFFIECYIRNVRYQIKRNSGYYIFFVPMFFLGSLLLAIQFLSGETGSDPMGVIASVDRAFWAAFFGLFIVYYLFLTNSARIVEEVNQLDWLGFDNFNVDQAMDDVVGKYAEDVGFWKNRVRGGGTN